MGLKLYIEKCPRIENVAKNEYIEAFDGYYETGTREQTIQCYFTELARWQKHYELDAWFKNNIKEYNRLESSRAYEIKLPLLIKLKNQWTKEYPEDLDTIAQLNSVFQNYNQDLERLFYYPSH